MKVPTFEEIEASLIREGHIPAEPTPEPCSCCGNLGIGHSSYEGAYVFGSLCRNCRIEADRMEGLLDDRGKPLERHVQLDPKLHLFFLEPDEVWLLTPERMDPLPPFEPWRYSVDELREKVGMMQVFL